MPGTITISPTTKRPKASKHETQRSRLFPSHENLPGSLQIGRALANDFCTDGLKEILKAEASSFGRRQLRISSPD